MVIYIFVCPCNSVTNKIVRSGMKSFENVLEEVKQCTCSFVSVAGKVDRADRWIDIASDGVLTLPVSSIVALFQFRYLALMNAPEQISVSSTSTTNPSAFEMLSRAQQLTHLPQPKVQGSGLLCSRVGWPAAAIRRRQLSPVN